MQFRQQITNLITDCNVTDFTLWEAFKAVMRGHITAYETKLKKDRQKEISEITAQLSALKSDYRTIASPAKLNEIIELKFKHNSILSNQVSMMLLEVKQ